MENTNKTDGKTSTFSQGVTERQDGHGNQVEYMSWKQFQDLVTNECMWCKGDQIQVKNISGSVISTTILIEDGEDGKRSLIENERVCCICKNKKHDIYWLEIDGKYAHKNCADFQEDK